MTEEFPDAQPKRRLGRGLNSLLGRGAPAAEELESGEPGTLREIPINAI